MCIRDSRFNFENESFEQCEEKVENEYSVNIPMRYYYKGKFRKGWISAVSYTHLDVYKRQVQAQSDKSHGNVNAGFCTSGTAQAVEGSRNKGT